MSEETGPLFKIGDHVQLSSGGPVMTVEGVNSDGSLACVWWQKDEYKRGSFDPAVLVAAP